MKIKLDNFKDEILQKLEVCLKENKRIFDLAGQEIEQTYQKCKANKKFKYKDKDKQNWYYEHLKERIKKKIYHKYKFDFFGTAERIINDVLPKSINTIFVQFSSIENIGWGK